MKRVLALALAAVVAAGSFAAVPADAYTDSSLGPKSVARVGKSTKNVTKGAEFELEVRKGKKVKDSNLYWTTSNKGIVKVVDDDRTDDEIDLKAVGVGTAKVTCKNNLTGVKVVYTIKVKAPSKTISRVGKATKIVEVGDDLELEVKKSGLKESQIKWTIGNTKLLRFEDGDRYGSEIEVEAKKTGTTKVTATNLYNGSKVVYTIKIVPDYDD